MSDAASNHREGVWIPVSVGELIDKITILQIKREKLSDPSRRANVEAELSALRAVAADHQLGDPEGLLAALAEELETVNRVLWSIEDNLRQLEQEQRFDDAFVQLARSVYQRNDARAAIKRRINELSGSALVEEKLHPAYGHSD